MSLKVIRQNILMEISFLANMKRLTTYSFTNKDKIFKLKTNQRLTTSCWGH